MVSSALDVAPDGFNDYEKNLVAKVREYGWYRTAVHPDEEGPGFSYTLGFWLTTGTPDMIAFSLGDACHAIFSDAFLAAKDGQRFPIGQRFSGLLAGFDAVLLPVEPSRYGEYLLSARWFYGNEDWPCLQLFWPDPKGYFPWESNFDPAFTGMQPNLTGKPWPAI